MLNRMAIFIALKSAWRFDKSPGLKPDKTAINKSYIVLQLISDIFWGEILKTHLKKGWHFYNRINRVRIDFTNSGSDKICQDYHFEDIPSNTEGINYYFKQDQYFPFYMSL